MPPSTVTYPPDTTNGRPDRVPYPALPHFDAKTNSDSPSLGRDKPLPPIPSVRDANALEKALQCQRDVLHPSFQTPVVTVQTKTCLIRSGKFLHPGHYAYTEPRDLSRNRLSLPPPYTAVDPNAPPRSSRIVRWLDQPVDNPHKHRGNIGLGLGYPLDTSSNTNHVASTHGQAPGGRVCCFFRSKLNRAESRRNDAVRNTPSLIPAMQVVSVGPGSKTVISLNEDEHEWPQPVMTVRNCTHPIGKWSYFRSAWFTLYELGVIDPLIERKYQQKHVSRHILSTRHRAPVMLMEVQNTEYEYGTEVRYSSSKNRLRRFIFRNVLSRR
ncbi:hypothetical protein ARMGADRAFT_1037534 [Armillaria gallica]|uniref:Uncharacterized protein n=1 Tax=Armillaria gallica TaxID=47427 RepID=A0A2H3CLF7_ARMGA|nr:hypothetical protein ARMGADRAFT_1037534 [Armillaria gallica]